MNINGLSVYPSQMQAQHCTPLAMLKHHVTGAIERGEAVAIVAKPVAAKPVAAKTAIVSALRAFIRQRPGLEFRNYCSSYADKAGRSAYFKELRGITKMLHDAKLLLVAVESEAGITGQALSDAFSAYSGRLSWDGARLDYVTGQYWPTEYRSSVCAVLASALWNHKRDTLIIDETEACPDHAPGVKNVGEAMRKYFRERFGRGLASRWFS